MASTATLIHLSSHEVSSPGPGAYQIPSEFGKKAAHIYRQYEKVNHNLDPEIVALPSTIGTGPKYHFGARHYQKDTENTPGPNYVPPSFGSGKPALHFHSKGIAYKDRVPIGPGPGSYNSLQKSYSPRFTMKSREVPKEPGPDGPGPGLYFPNYSYLEPHSSTPHMTKGETRDFKEQTPGPNYLPNEHNHVPSLTFRHPATTRSKPQQPTPGPSDYSYIPKTGSESPRFTIKHRPETKSSRPDAALVSIPSSIGTGPKYSLTSRRPKKEDSFTPGPSYVPPPFGSDSPKLSLHSKGSFPSVIVASGAGPGPGKYDARENNRLKYSYIRGKTGTRDIMAEGPGPGKYLPQFDNVLPSSPKAHILNKYAQKAANQGGEYSYMPQNKVKGITIGHKDNSNVAPGTFV